MNEQTAIELLKALDLLTLHKGYAGSDEYMTAIDLAIAALQKQVPVKVANRWNNGDYPHGCCGKCGEKVYYDEEFCSTCGQKLDWSDRP